MTAWKGLGVNYKSKNKIVQDMEYFKAIRLQYIRPHIPTAPIPWRSDMPSVKAWRDIAKQFHDAGFYVLWGYSLGTRPVTTANWKSYHDSVVAEARYCVEYDACDEFGIGNEIESYIDGVTMTPTILRQKIRELAHDVKQVCPLPLSYAATGGSGSLDWINDPAGLGELDYLTSNFYSGWLPSKQFRQFHIAWSNRMRNKFGDKWYLSEFNVESGAAIYNSIPEDKREEEIRRMQAFFKRLGVPRAYLYQYRAIDDRDGSDSFFVRHADGSIRPAWVPLSNNNGRRPV